MALGTKASLGSCHIVLDGDPAPQKGQSSQFSAHVYCGLKGCMYQDTTWYGGRPQHRRHCVGWGLSSPTPKEAQLPIFGNLRCGQTAGWTKMPLGIKVGVAPGDFVFDGDPAPQKNGHSPTQFWPMFIVAKRLDE